MSKCKDLTGEKFGRLTVIEYVRTNDNKKRIYKCKCECGNTVEVVGAELKKGTKSCGCLRRERGKEKYINLVGQTFGKYTVITETRKRNPTKFICKCECGNTVEVRSGDLINGHSKGCNKCSSITHNMSNTRIYKIWKDMRNRCLNKNVKEYINYGGRGITVCKDWKDSFKNFYEWASKNGYTEELTIDRIDVNGNYEYSNCRWATMSVQNKNKRFKQYEIKGEIKTFPQWCEYANLEYNLVYQRVHTLGESLERALRLDEK